MDKPTASEAKPAAAEQSTEEAATATYDRLGASMRIPMSDPCAVSADLVRTTVSCSPSHLFIELITDSLTPANFSPISLKGRGQMRFLPALATTATTL